MSISRFVFAAAVTGLLFVNSSQAENTQGITATTIKVGNVGPYSGSGAPVSVINYGIEAYLRYVNDHGGVNGRKFKSIMYDAACSATKGIAVAKKAIFEDKVFAFLGPSCSGAAMAMKPIIDQEGMIWVGSAGDPKLTTPTVPSMFHVIYNGDAAGANMARFVLGNENIKKVALVQHSNEWSHGSCVPAANALKKGGVDVVADLALERGASDASAQVLQLKARGAQAIMACLYQPELVLLLRDMKRYGVKAPVVGALGADFDQVVRQVNDPDAVKNIFYLPYPYQAKLNEGVLKPYHDMMIKYLTKSELPHDGEPTNFYYFGMQVAVAFVEGVKRAGPDLSREKFIAAMEGMKGFDTHVFADNITLSHEDHVGLRKTNYVGIDSAGRQVLYSGWNKPLAN